MVRPNLIGGSLFALAGGFLSIPRVTEWGDQSDRVRFVRLGNPEWLHWMSIGPLGTLDVEPVAIPLGLLLFFGSMVIGAWLHTRLGPNGSQKHLRWLAIPFGALLLSLVLSTLMWGYPWSRPAIDGRVTSIQWHSIGGFHSDADGTKWAPYDLSLPRLIAEQESERTAVHNLPVAIAQLQPLASLDALGASEMEEAEKAVLSMVELERGETGYPYGRRLVGVVARGRDAQGVDHLIAGFNGGEVSGDHHPDYEVFLSLGERGPRPVSIRKYHFDVAGIEGVSAGVMTIVFTLLGMVLIPSVWALWLALNEVAAAYGLFGKRPDAH